METGINFTQRNYNLYYSIPDSNLSAKNDVRIIAYSIPVSGLIFIRLAEDFYMNTSLGCSMDFYPSYVHVITPAAGSQNHFLMEGIYRYKMQGSMQANIGFEYRTKKYGYFYLGATYNLPFTAVSEFALSYEFLAGKYVSYGNVKGSYATIDLRYFFNERKEKKYGDKKED